MEENPENKLENSRAVYGISNAIIQTGAILSANYIGIIWPMYFVMGMISLLGIIQTIAVAAMLFKLTEAKNAPLTRSEPYHILLGFIYTISGYQLYLMGFEVFAGFAIAHALIYTLSHLFKSIKQ